MVYSEMSEYLRAFKAKSTISKVMLSSAFLAILASVFYTGLLLAKPKNPLLNSKAVKEAISVQRAMRQIYREVNPAVVRIETESVVDFSEFRHPYFRFFFDAPRRDQKHKQQGLGSGFILSSDGYIVTNHHVIAKRRSNKYVDEIKVKLINGKSYEAKVIGSDSVSDIALLKIRSSGELKEVYIGNSENVEVGDFAIAIGNPFGLSSTFTMGVISSKGQEVESQDGVPRIQTDAPINQGNSGGPLINIRGEVIGINQMIFTKNASGGSIGIGFAIPINYAMSVVRNLKKGKKVKHGFIGVQIVPNPTEDQLSELDLEDRSGLLVANVTLGSPAWKAGVRPYDFITHIDGKRAKKFSQLKGAVVQKGVGSNLQLTVLRGGSTKKFTIKIGEAKS